MRTRSRTIECAHEEGAAESDSRDYNFASIQRELNRAILIAGDAPSGLVLCIVVPSKEVSHDHVASVTNCLLEAGRTGAMLQGDNEQSIRSLIAKVCAGMPGLSKRFSPLYSSQSLGSVCQAQRQLYAQIRALRPRWKGTIR